MVAAVVDLMTEGHLPPTTAQVVQRSGISEASLFRYFPSLDDLQLHATAELLDRHSALFDIAALGQGDLTKRIDRFCRARSALWQTVAPIARLGRARSFDHPALAELLLSIREDQADQIATHFSPELSGRTPQDRADTVAVLVTLTSFEAWDIQGRELHRSPDQIRRSWKRALSDLLGDSPSARPQGSSR